MNEFQISEDLNDIEQRLEGTRLIEPDNSMEDRIVEQEEKDAGELWDLKQNIAGNMQF